MTAPRKKAPKKKRTARKKRWGPPHAEKPAKRIEGERLKPISLHPLDFEEAVRRLIATDPKTRRNS